MATYTFVKSANKITINGIEDEYPEHYTLSNDGEKTLTIQSQSGKGYRVLITDTITINGDAFSGTLSELQQALYDGIFVQASGGGSILVASVTLTDAQIKALSTNPSGFIELVPAPGVGKAISLINAVLYFDIDGGAYTNIDADCALLIGYGDWATAASILSRMPSDSNYRAAYLTPAAYVDGRPAWPDSLTYYPDNYYNFENVPLKIVASNGSAGDFTGGNAANTLKVTVYYVVVDL